MIYCLQILIELINETKNGDKHDLNFSLRLLAHISFATIVGVLSGTYFGALYYIGLRFAIFDISFALLRGQRWDYLGSNKLDLILKKTNRWALLALRVVVLIITILYYERII